MNGVDQEMRFVYDLVKPLRVEPGQGVRLADFDPRDTGGLPGKAEAAGRLEEGIKLLVDYQARLWAQGSSGVLLILQGLDASGKDGTVEHVMHGVNPQGVEVSSFKQPSSEELAHDFLWRYQRALPERGRIGIYNRSHYEEVLVVRVHRELLAAEGISASAAKDVWEHRYRDINNWERTLTDSGIRVVKVMLNLSKRAQAKRFLRRIDDPKRNWKFSPSDIEERHYWNDYQDAFAQMLSNTSTEWAPWYVVPADRKWFTRLATAAVLVRALAELDPTYPKPDPEVREEMVRARAGLLAEVGV
jgi:PPK2 family polyphosphate:nucleotide phosphotransferase